MILIVEDDVYTSLNNPDNILGRDTSYKLKEIFYRLDLKKFNDTLSLLYRIREEFSKEGITLLFDVSINNIYLMSTDVDFDNIEGYVQFFLNFENPNECLLSDDCIIE